MKVLIIESDRAFAESAADAIRARGAKAVVTDDGQVGMDLAKVDPPSAVILSVELGDRLNGGFSWCNRIKKDEDLKGIPLVLISSLSSEETFEQHRRLKTRADGYLLKPFSPEVLVETLQGLVPDGALLAPPSRDPSSERPAFDELGDEDEPLFAPLLAQEPEAREAAPPRPPQDLPEDLDLEDLFTEETESFESSPLGWTDVAKGFATQEAQEERREPAPSAEEVRALPFEDEDEEEEWKDRLRLAEVEATIAKARIDRLEEQLSEGREEIQRLEQRLAKTTTALEAARRKSEEMLLEAQSSSSWKEKARELERALSEERSRTREAQAALEAERSETESLRRTASQAEELARQLQQKAEREEEVLRRAQKAIAVAGELMESLAHRQRQEG